MKDRTELQPPISTHMITEAARQKHTSATNTTKQRRKQMPKATTNSITWKQTYAIHKLKLLLEELVQRNHRRLVGGQHCQQKEKNTKEQIIT